MKSKFLKAVVIIMAVFMIAVFAACTPEVIYYLDATDGAVHGGTVIDDNNNGSGGEGGGSTVVVDDNPGDGSTYNLRVWCAEEDVDMIWEMLYAYEAKYYKNTYNWTLEKQGEDTVVSKIFPEPDDAADVFSFANDQLGKLVNGDALVSIPTAYTAQIDNQIQVARTASMMNGKYYAIPYSYENCFLYYNKSLLSAADVKSMDGLLSKSIGSPYTLGIDMDDSYYTTMFLYTAGVQIFGENGTDPTSVDLANEKAYKACEYIASLKSSKGKLKPIAKDSQYSALKNKDVAAMISGPHMISLFKNALGANFGVAMLPTIRFSGDTTDTQLVSFSGVKMYGVTRRVSRSDAATQEAMKLAAYLANTENQQKRLDEREFCPTDTDLFTAAVDSGIETVEVVVNQSEASKLKPGIIEMGDYWEPMGAFLAGVYKNTYSRENWEKELQSIENKLKGNVG